VELQLNSIGSLDARRQYREALVDYLGQHKESLDPDSQRRLDTNPLRILDSKNPETQALLDAAPSLTDFLDDESRADFDQLCELLEAAGVSFVINHRLVRGLDYYNKTVFEWVTDRLGAQGTVCAGGRYDGLVAQLGGKDTPAVGFAMGMERLVLLLEETGAMADISPTADVYVISAGSGAHAAALSVVEGLRGGMPATRFVQHTGGGSFKSQVKKADKSGAQLALIWGEDEIASGTVTIKPLRDRGGERPAQKTVALEQLQAALEHALAGDSE
jgi:histidyl-tRNA synthetase